MSRKDSGNGGILIWGPEPQGPKGTQQSPGDNCPRNDAHYVPKPPGINYLTMARMRVLGLLGGPYPHPPPEEVAWT